MVNKIKRVEFTVDDCSGSNFGSIQRTRCEGFTTLELLGLLTFERERLLNEMFSVPQIDAEFDESEVKPDEPE